MKQLGIIPSGNWKVLQGIMQSGRFLQEEGRGTGAVRERKELFLGWGVGWAEGRGAGQQGFYHGDASSSSIGADQKIPDWLIKVTFLSFFCVLKLVLFIYLCIYFGV